MTKRTCCQCKVDDFEADKGEYHRWTDDDWPHTEYNEFFCDNCAELNKEQYEAHKRGLSMFMGDRKGRRIK